MRSSPGVGVRRASLALAATVLAGFGSGCGDHEFEPPDRAERVARAEADFDLTLFDSITWADSAAQVTEGNAVYAAECSRCHGPLGAGGTDYARGRGLEVPTLAAAEWRMADQDSLRRRIFVGHAAGMPVFGDGDLTLRQIDATAAYILRALRPDALSQD